MPSGSKQAPGARLVRQMAVSINWGWGPNKYSPTILGSVSGPPMFGNYQTRVSVVRARLGRAMRSAVRPGSYECRPPIAGVARLDCRTCRVSAYIMPWSNPL